jgi:hypothetical protein
MGGLLVIDEFENGVGETKLGIGISSLAGDTWIADGWGSGSLSAPGSYW